MTANKYRELMIAVMEMVKHDSNPHNSNSEYYEGILRGLDIAIQKLQDSEFLANRDW